jgi:hypothetical protein
MSRLHVPPKCIICTSSGIFVLSGTAGVSARTPGGNYEHKLEALMFTDIDSCEVGHHSYAKRKRENFELYRGY